MKKETFSQKCYRVLKKVPKGKVTTYKELAHALGSRAYRAVGTAMKKNPTLIKVPCHRAINSTGSVGSFALGPKKKITLLKKEGIPIKSGKVVDFQRYLYKF
jgi:methylated-DNA-[protein]-cysteine S-methyltransferase